MSAAPAGLWDVLLLRGGYNATVVQSATLLLGAAAGSVGAFALLRGRSLMGDALAHATLPGIGVAFLIASAIGLDPRAPAWLLLGAAVFGVLGVGFVHVLTRSRRLSEDAAMAVVLSSMFGLGVVILSHIQSLPGGNQAGLRSLILGQAAAMRTGDAITMGVLALICALGVTLLFKELRLVCFDGEFASARGWPTGAIDLALMALVVTVTVIGIQAVGIVLIVALLVVPPASARLWTDRLWRVVALSAGIGAVSGYVGAAISAVVPRMPTGGAIVLCAGAVFVVSLLIAPSRGLAASALRLARLRVRIGREHALRSACEWLEERGEQVENGARVPVADALRAVEDWPLWRWFVRISLRVRRFARIEGAEFVLDLRGASEAQRISRAHRLWELYLERYLHVAPTHVHSPADLVEHTLSPELVAELERAVDAERSSMNGAGGPR